MLFSVILFLNLLYGKAIFPFTGEKSVLSIRLFYLKKKLKKIKKGRELTCLMLHLVSQHCFAALSELET